MPYIKSEDRERLVGIPGELYYDAIRSAGELNYVLTIICKMYFEENGGHYQQINDIIGALEGCKLEFYRRLVAPYEDKKIQENGDVF